MSHGHQPKVHKPVPPPRSVRPKPFDFLQKYTFQEIMEEETMTHAIDKERKSALQTQVGGGHYKDLAIQPVEYNHKNNIGFIEGNVIKYVTRWRSKNGVQDLEKARHFLDLLIEMETTKPE